MNESASVAGIAAGAKASSPGNFFISDQAPSSLDWQNGGSLFRGGFDFVTSGRIRGWAIRVDRPRSPVNLQIHVAGVLFGDAATEHHRSDLAHAAPGNLAGFDLSLSQWGLSQARSALERLQNMSEAELAAPADLAVVFAGQPSRIAAATLGLTNRALHRQLEAVLAMTADPAAFFASARPSLDLAPMAAPGLDDLTVGARYRLGLDFFKDGVLQGWAVDLVQPQKPLKIAVMSDGEQLDLIQTSAPRPDFFSILPNNVVAFSLDLRKWPSERLQKLERRMTARPGRPETNACQLILALGEAKAPIGLGDFGVSDAELALQVRAVLLARQAEAAKAAEAQRNRAASPPSAQRPAASAPGQDQIAWLGRFLSEERRLILRRLGGGADDASLVWSRQVELGLRRWRAIALAEEVRSLAVVSDRVKAHAAAIAELFDGDFYKSLYGEAVADVDNPLLHYVLVGWRAGLRPHPLFDVAFYRRQMGSAQGEPLLHFVREGAVAGFDPYPLFDTNFYRATHMKGAEKANPLLHYLTIGGPARLDPSLQFDTAAYLASSPDPDAIVCPLEDFVTDKSRHDFEIVPAFDALLYRYQLEVERGQGLFDPPIAHYLGHGYLDETLLPNLFLDPAFYRTRNEIALNGPALLHYLREGDAAGLATHPFFSPKIYNEERGEDRDETTAIEHAMRSGEAMLRSDRRMKTPLDPQLLQFFDALVVCRDDFDPDFYRRANVDLAELNDEALAAHWRAHGEPEGRFGSPLSLMKRAGMLIRDVPLGFFAEEYVALNPDLQQFGWDFLSSFCHFVTCGRNERDRMYGRWQFFFDDIKIDLPTTAAPLRIAPAQERINVCVLIHVFYPEVWQELAAFAQNFRNRSFDIFINLVDLSWTPELHEEIRSLCPGAYLQLSNDAGRDIGGFARLLDHVDLDRYDLVAFMHTKKSPHIAIERADHWRRTLLRAFAGSAEVADECVDLMLSDPAVGMIGAQEWRSSDMGKNFDEYERLLDILEITGANRELDYLSGFMFLTRSDIVKRLHGVLKTQEWEYGGDQGVEFHIDGQIAHGVERAMPALVRHMGCKVLYR